MKILVISNLYPPDSLGGYEMGCRQAVDALRARGHEVRVLTTAPRSPVETPPHVDRTLRLTDLWNHYVNAMSPLVLLRLNEAEAFWVSAFNVHVLLAALEDFRPDVAYVWMLAGVGGAGLVGCLEYLRVPWVWHLMDLVPTYLCKAQGRVQPGLAGEFNRRFRGTFLTCSRQLVDDIEASGVTLGGRVEVIPNWVEGPFPPPRDAYLHGDALRVVAAAAFLDLSYNKGIDLLIRAAALLRDRGREGFTIDVFGKVTDPFYADLIRKHRLSGRVRLMGSVGQPELLRAYEDYDVCAFPGRPGEPFGFVPLEAASRGCVPIIARGCGASEWLVHGVHCLKVNRSAEGFAAALGRILDGAVDLEPIGRRASALARDDLDIGAVVVSIERALERASAAPRSGGGSPSEAYRLALLAEKLSNVLIQEACCA